MFYFCKVQLSKLAIFTEKTHILNRFISKRANIKGFLFLAGIPLCDSVINCADYFSIIFLPSLMYILPFTDLSTGRPSRS